jgi:3-oxoacyl-[acyl-carrier protein] reductase
MATSGKVAIVTGSATGLGAECAIDLAGRGWHLVINYTKSKKEADETFAAVKAKGAEAILVQADVGQDADCKKLIDETMKKWGRIDGLINNAGTTKFQNQGDLDGVTPEDFDKILRVNVTGPYMMSRAAYPVMKKQWEEKQERGSIVNISSIAGVMGVGSSIPYACSKGALNTLTLTLARWFSPAVRVNTVCPGFIQTRWLLGGMGEVNYNKMKEMQEQTTPLRQAGTTAQMAEAVLFFLTSASNITGEFLIVDAGMHLASLPMKAHGRHATGSAREKDRVDRADACCRDATARRQVQPIGLRCDGVFEVDPFGHHCEAIVDKGKGQGGTVRAAERDLGVLHREGQPMAEALADDLQETPDLFGFARS